MIYSEISERILQGVLRVKPQASRSTLTMQIDALWPQINREVSETFAGIEDNRPLMRRTFALTFAGGTATLSDLVLGKYLMDARLTVTVSEGDPPLVYDYIDSVDYHRTQDSRIGKWKVDGLVITAESPADSEDGAIPLVGTASFNCVACPDVPSTALTVYAGLPDTVPALIDAGINFLLGQPINQATK